MSSYRRGASRASTAIVGIAIGERARRTTTSALTSTMIRSLGHRHHRTAAVRVDDDREGTRLRGIVVTTTTTTTTTTTMMTTNRAIHSGTTPRRGSTGERDAADVRSGPMVSSSSSSPADPPPSSSSTPRKNGRRRRRRRRGGISSSSSSPLPPPSSRETPSSIARILELSPLTRRQALRLTPRQRAAVLRESSIRGGGAAVSASYLESARANARANLRYLRDKAGDGGAANFRANVDVMRRLLFDGDVDAVVASAGRNAPRDGSSSSSSPGGRETGIDWERAPSEVASNLRRNLHEFRGWLHAITDGRIPASSSSSSSSSAGGASDGGGSGGSVATRIRDFHEMKQGSGALVMDNWWIGKNVALALLPGLIVHLYFWSLQDEMREYFSRYERIEREKIMGTLTTTATTTTLEGEGETIDGRRGGGDSVVVVDGNNSGINSALIPGEGNAWDRLKVVVEDLFLGGAERRISELKGAQGRKMDDEDASSDRHTAPVANSSPNRGDEMSDDASLAPVYNSSTVNDDPNVRMLLERIEALERQLGIGVGATMSEDELRRRRAEKLREEHEMRRKIERIRQSPIQNRREDSLEARWRNEAKKYEEQNDDRMTKKEERINLILPVMLTSSPLLKLI
ncbi:hypothetical protein ACHAW5_008279 [Stephanodiscus triporus]|uniref:Uncharacterized protein n=1 Tax=Stephanodiscus triporus TaxID=2934178 RepID=A0ABD3MTS1_9STRA